MPSEIKIASVGALFHSPMSASVLCAGFWTPARRRLRTLNWPASKKRQGTKSREVGHRLGSGRYGDLMRGPMSMMHGTPGRRQLQICTYARSGESGRHFWLVFGADQRV